MRIAFWLTTPKKFDPINLDNETFGGAEVSAICLAKEFEKKREVYVFCNCTDNVPANSDYVNGVLFLHYSQFSYYDIDVLIVVRPSNILHPISLPKRPKVVILWTGDDSTQPTNDALWDGQVIKNIDLIITKSYWQKRDLLKRFHLLNGNKIDVMFSGFDDNFIEEYKPVTKPKFICASIIFRGIHNFIEIWPKIKKEIPKATLDIYSSTKLYSHEHKGDYKYKKIFNDLSLLKGVKLKEPIPHNEFLRKLPDYYAMLYPNSGFNETSCAVVLESMAYGVPVISSNKAGLEETLKRSVSGFGIDIDVHLIKYKENFIREVVWLWKNKESKNKISIQGKKQLMENYPWSVVSKKWYQLLETLLKKSKGSRKSSLVSLADIPRTQDLHSTIITH